MFDAACKPMLPGTVSNLLIIGKRAHVSLIALWTLFPPADAAFGFE